MDGEQSSSAVTGAQGVSDSGGAAPHDLILYDGVCGLCNHFVKTVLDHDPRAQFQFASLQSELGRSILTSMGRDPEALKTIYLVKNFGTPGQQVLTKARAALDIFSRLEGPIRYLSAFSFLPTAILNVGYDAVAANRYHIFGRLDTCPLPNPEHVKRFLDL